jgi:uroporphyrinogen III methyltransferase / synthase
LSAYEVSTASKLKGRTVLVTRTSEGNAVERKKLEALGATVVELPAIELGPPSDAEPLEKAIEEISSFDWIVFTSASGVEAFFQRVKRLDSIRAKFACVGPQTSRALEARGFSASFVPEEFLTKKLGIELTKKFDMRDKKVIMARSENANPEICMILREAGAIVVEAPVYRTIPSRQHAHSGMLDEITDITLASPSAVDGLISNFSSDEINSRKIRVYCIGPVTTERAIHCGLRVTGTAKEHTIDGLIMVVGTEGMK